ncbi:MAG: hypothetical protein HY791_21805 [Deltaproteobacteria bacterium]|nr:hypothetical protein [Deltaproteobacteria bacterium]
MHAPRKKQSTGPALVVVVGLSAMALLGHAARASAEGSEPTRDDASAALTGYDKGFFLLSHDGRFLLRSQAAIQARFEIESLDSAGDRDAQAAFLIPRGRLLFGGHAFMPALTWQFQAAFDRGSVALKDLYLDYTVVPGWLRLRGGQWKRPFSRQFLNSGLRQEFVDRAMTHAFFGAGRDIGFGVHNGNTGHSPYFEYALAVFNGTGDVPQLGGDVVVDPSTGRGEITSGKFGNVPGVLHPVVVMRVGYIHAGIDGYSEADLEGGPLRFAVGSSGLFNFDADGDDVSGIQGEVDYALKLHGFSTTGAVYVSAAQSGPAFGDQAFRGLGFHLQAGYVIAERFQPAARYAFIARTGPDDDLQEITLGFSVYFFGHDVKWQTDGALSSTGDPKGDRSDYRLRTQAQLAF